MLLVHDFYDETVPCLGTYDECTTDDSDFKDDGPQYIDPIDDDYQNT